MVGDGLLTPQEKLTALRDLARYLKKVNSDLVELNSIMKDDRDIVDAKERLQQGSGSNNF